jgi:hypothetical protein
MSAHPFPVGTPVRFVRVDVVRDVWIGDAGTVVESFAPDAGRNVRLEADGRVVNVPLEMLRRRPRSPRPTSPTTSSAGSARVTRAATSSTGSATAAPAAACPSWSARS